MKAIIEEGCIACGLCEEICPDVFEMIDLAEVKPDADVDSNIDDVQRAVDECPVGVIKIIS
ncbi:MAG: ferredoxin [Bacteroidales bacterium]|nr:ferredoxin [Bacteroidales bacterium]NLK82404.1 ferredoxin [Bacteroidales bacterium]HPY83221.1 ferredoxin [Bacteroidales bacterium]